MVMLLATVALALAPQAPGALGMTLLGKPVPLAAPAPSPAALPAEVLGWSGWSYLGGAPAKDVPAFAGDGDWSAELARMRAAPAAPGATPWHVKVVILRATDLVSRDAAGVLREHRSTLDGPAVQKVLDALVLSARAFETGAGGGLKVVYDVETDDRVWQGPEEFPPQEVVDYLRPKLNAGAFVADDGKFRGPYNLALLVHSGLTAEASFRATAMSTPVAAISANALPTVSELALSMCAAERDAAEVWISRHGRRLEPNADPAAGPADEAWSPFGDAPREAVARLAATAPPDGASYAAAAAAPPIQRGGLLGGQPARPLPASPDVKLSLVPDDTYGKVLEFSGSSFYRQGGFSLPVPAAGPSPFDGPNRYLVFFAKTTSPDCLGVGAIVGARPAPATANERLGGVSLGPRPDGGPAIPLPPDGAWHKVALDLDALGAKGGVYIGSLPGMFRYERERAGPLVYDFADFQLAAAAPSDALAVGRAPESARHARLVAVRAAGIEPASLANQETLASALLDPYDRVRLNALDALGVAKVPALETQILANFDNLDRRVSALAVRAAAAIGSPSADAALRQALRAGPSDYLRGEAARALAPSKDPKLAGPISALIGLGDWRVRLAGAEALAEDGGPVGPVLLATFLQDVEPAIRLAVVLRTNVDDPDGARSLQFVSVNDPSDEVRVQAAIRLLGSSIADARKDGFRAASDDSWWVRREAVEFMARNPKPEYRATFLQAVAGPFEAVRAVGLDGLAALAGPVALSDLAPVLQDPYPDVEVALLILAKAKSIVLPAETLTLLRASPSPQVAGLLGK